MTRTLKLLFALPPLVVTLCGGWRCSVLLRSFFEWENANHRGVVPFLVHNNWVVGKEIKEHRFK
jgi:hypothetical protein